jgi:hypothetical protein
MQKGMEKGGKKEWKEEDRKEWAGGQEINERVG